MQKDSPMNNLMFRLMSLEYKIKTFISSPEEILKETAVKEGDRVVDYGCGPGRYTIPLAEIVGGGGQVYAIDIHPLALKKVKKMAGKKGIQIIKPMFARDIPSIATTSIDAVILFDTLHDINDKSDTLKKINRLLKSEGLLLFKDHHMEEDEIISLVEENTQLDLSGGNEEIIKFKK